MDDPRLIPYGDSAILVQYDMEGYSEVISDAVHRLSEQLRQTGHWDEVVSGYDSVLICFDLTHMTMDQAHRQIKDVVSDNKPGTISAGKLVKIPVHYGGEDGPDMTNIMTSSGLSESDVIARHSGLDYRVCMTGFLPGFVFLSEADPVLRHPRHAEPRLSIPAGSVGIAGWQTGIYGLESPGGWQIIGRTPWKMFDKMREDPFLLKAGDIVRFLPTERLGR